MEKENKGLGTLEIVALVMSAFIILIIAWYTVGELHYRSEQTTATVTDIEYVTRGGIYGGTNAIVSLSDGSVYKLWEIPDGLKEGHTYTLEYREPHLVRDPYLVIIEEIQE